MMLTLRVVMSEVIQEPLPLKLRISVKKSVVLVKVKMDY